MKTTLFIDLDGTLLDVHARHYAVYATASQELGFEPLTSDAYWQLRRTGKSSADALGDVPADVIERFAVMWLDRIELDENLALDQCYRGVLPVLERLSQRFRLALVTLRRDREALLRQLRSRRIYGYFSSVLSLTAYVRLSKADLVGQWAGPAIVIGDSEADIELAEEMGARCICLDWGLRSREFLRDVGARAVVGSLDDLAARLEFVVEGEGEGDLESAAFP